MGRHAVAVFEKQIRAERPQLVISAGFSGALQPDVPVGTIVIGENFTDPHIARQLRVPEGVRVARIVTSDEIVGSAEEKSRRGRESGALAVDLESAHLHAACVAWRVPMLSIRSIADPMEQNLPVPAHLLVDPESGRADSAAIFRFLFRHPANVPEFARLVGNARTAQTALADALVKILPSLLRL
jgi:adenosylhomocysteine nucleosidase